MGKLSYTFDTKDAASDRIVDAVCEIYGYAANIPDPDPETDGLATIPNPTSKDEFVKAVLADVLAAAVLESDRRAAIARAQAVASAITKIEIT